LASCFFIDFRSCADMDILEFVAGADALLM
jgi:hypothetical protein